MFIIEYMHSHRRDKPVAPSKTHDTGVLEQLAGGNSPD
jgi:hypothetical protein